MVVHPKAATIDEIIEFAVERFAALPVRKIILLQYPRHAMRLANPAIEQAQKHI
jgi:hypothetical protein